MDFINLCVSNCRHNNGRIAAGFVARKTANAKFLFLCIIQLLQCEIHVVASNPLLLYLFRAIPMLPLLAVNISLKFLSYENTASAVDIYE